MSAPIVYTYYGTFAQFVRHKLGYFRTRENIRHMYKICNQQVFKMFKYLNDCETLIF